MERQNYRHFDTNYFPRSDSVKRLPEYKQSNGYTIPLKDTSTEYVHVENLMNMSHIKIVSISKIKNLLLERSYLLKKEQKMKEKPFLKEVKLFHGTTKKSAKNICQENFDWRRFGSRSHHCYFGQGVYFTHDANISRTYPKIAIGKRYMLFSKVLVGVCVIGDPKVDIPPYGTDTTISKNFKEIIKYEDNEFLPIYKVVFKIESDINEESSLTIDAISFKDMIFIKQAKPFTLKESVSKKTPFEREEKYNRFSPDYSSEEDENYSSDYSDSLTEDDDCYSGTSFDEEDPKQYRKKIYVYLIHCFGFIRTSLSHAVQSIWDILFPPAIIPQSDESDSSYLDDQKIS